MFHWTRILIACLFNQLSYVNSMSEQVNFESQLTSSNEYLLTAAHHMGIRMLMMIWCNVIPKMLAAVSL